MDKKIKNMIFVFFVFVLLVSVSKIKAEQKPDYIFEYSLGENSIDIDYITSWKNTTISLKDNDTPLFLENESSISIVVEGKSTWIYNRTIGRHNITFHIYNGEIEIFLFYTMLDVPSTIFTPDTIEPTLTETSSGFLVIVYSMIAPIIIVKVIRKRR